MNGYSVFSPRSLGLLAAGALWFLLAWAWTPFFWIGLLHNLLWAALVLVDRSLLRSADRVSLRRELEEPLSLGAPNRVALRIAYHENIPLQLQIRDEPPHPFAVDQQTLTLSIGPGDTKEVSYHITPRERGLYRFGRLNVRFRTPMGLLILQRSYPLEREVKVYPNILETKKHRLLARRNQLTQMGLRVSRLRGTGLEFESLREYVPDDELRRVDWKATARRGALVTREYNFERSRQLILMIDCGRTMMARGAVLSKLDYAINAAMLLAYVGVQNDDRVGLLTFAEEILDYLPPMKGRPQINAVMERLYAVQPHRAESDYRRAFLLAAHKLTKRSLFVLFTDLVDPDSSGRLIAHVMALRRAHLLLCIALREPEVDRWIRSYPSDESELYCQAVAISVLEDRRRALHQLSSQGVLTLDAAPEDLSIAVVNKYLKLKQEARF